MEQQIRFCTASDGVRIAYAVIGEGPPLVYATGWPEHLEVEWGIPSVREFLEALAEGFTLVRYDMRGSGLSDRDVSDLSLHTLVTDLEAVVDHLALDRFPLLSLGALAGPVAMSYAAAHPLRVSHLVLYSAFLRGSELASRERQRALIDYTAAFGEPSWGTAAVDSQTLTDFRQLQKAAASRQTEAALLRTQFSTDVSHLLDRLPMPTLVLHARGDPDIPFAQGRELASRLPQARFVPFEGSTAGPLAVSHILFPEIRRFLGVEEHKPPSAAPSALVIILFTDMESSTTLTQRLGDTKAQEIVRAHNAIVREALKAHQGEEIKHTGDGLMASFHSASGAIECAIAIQRAFEEWNASLPAHPEPVEGRAERRPPAHPSRASRRAGGSVEAASEPIRVRIGLNAGEPVAEEQDLFGTAVQAAARICADAQPGEILASDVVRQLAAGKGFLFSNQGDVVLRGFEDPVRLYEVRWREE